MRSPDRKMSSIAIAAVFAVHVLAGKDVASQEPDSFEIGQVVSETELGSWNIDITPDGSGLPPGEGSAEQGRALYEARCLGCHGAEGQGKPMDRLAGGQGTLTSDKPVKTIGSYWPYATTVFDYVRRAMPLDEPQSLSADEVYALTAYLLQLNGIVGPDAIMNADTLPKVRMPNRGAFRPDPRPDTDSSSGSLRSGGAPSPVDAAQ